MKQESRTENITDLVLKRKMFFSKELLLVAPLTEADNFCIRAGKMKKKKELKIGHVLAQLMRDKNYSIKELAFESGVPASTIAHLKLNRPPKDVSTALAIAEVFGVSLHYMLYGEDDPREKRNPPNDFNPELFSGVFEIIVKRVNKK